MATKANVPLTPEMQQLVNDPNFVVEFAIGEPIPSLVPQSKDSGIKMSGVVRWLLMFGVHHFLSICTLTQYHVFSLSTLIRRRDTS